MGFNSQNDDNVCDVMRESEFIGGLLLHHAITVSGLAEGPSVFRILSRQLLFVTKSVNHKRKTENTIAAVTHLSLLETDPHLI